MIGNAIASGLHVLSAVVWVGGMFFAYMVARPAAAALLEPPTRLPMWRSMFGVFFSWVWAAVLLLPATGYWLSYSAFGGLARAGTHVHLMHGLAWVMIALFVYLYFFPYRRFKRAVGDFDWPTAAASLNGIRRIVLANLILGLTTVAVASAGRYLP